MPTLTIPNTFVAETDAEAAEVNSNFSTIAAHVNTYALQKDGTNTTLDSGIQISATANPTADGHLSRKAYVDAEIATAIATAAASVTVADEAADTTSFPLFATAATGDLAPKSNAALTFNAATGALGATEFVGGGSGLTGLDATELTGTIALARIPTTLSDMVVVEADEIRVDKNGTAADPAWCWDNDLDMGWMRDSWSASGTNERIGTVIGSEEVEQVWRRSDGNVYKALHSNLQGVVSGTTVEMETISVDGTNVKRYGFATSKRATKDAFEPFELSDDEWDALNPQTFIVKGKYVMPDGSHRTTVPGSDEAPADAIPLRRAGLVYEDTLAASPMLVTDEAPDWHAITTACIARIKLLEARVGALAS